MVNDIFAGGGVALKSNVLERKEDFVRTWAEWAALNRQQVRAIIDSGVPKTFTVPKGKVLFISSATLSGTKSPNAGIIFINTGGTLILPIIHMYLLVGKLGRFSVTFPSPIKVDAGEIITAGTSPLGGFATGMIHGWLENISGFV